MKRLCYCVVVIGLYDILVSSQYIQSPCPGVFDYHSDGGVVYGMIRVQPNGPVSSVTTRVNFTVATRINPNYVGKLEAIGTNQLLQQFNQGAPIVYRVHFPVTSVLPRLTSLQVNDNLLCYGPGDVPGPNQYVSTISLRHSLFLQPGSGSFVYQINPESKPNSVYDFGSSQEDGTQVFTFDGSDNRQGSWNSNIQPIFVINNTRPQYENMSPPRPLHEPTLPQPRPQYEQTPPPRRPQYEQTPPPPPPHYEPTPTTRPQYEPTLPPPRPQYEPTPPPPPTPTFAAVPPRLPTRPSTQVECGMIAGGNERLPLIYNGQSYSRGDWPWLVAIYRRKDGSLTFICSGTLVSDRHVVSAAHCMHQKNTYTSIKDIVVKVGVYNLEDWGDDVTVTRTLETAHIHESYNASTLANDISVFTFERNVEFSTYIRPACLWNTNTDLNRIVGASGVVAGWGTNELGPAGHGEPRMVRIPVVSTATCRASKPDFHKLTSANTLCAGDRNGAGPCLGDSGGGLYILDNGRWRLRGVVSLSLRPENGDNTCNLNEYIVFTDAAQYLKWIKGVMSN
ncbi:serine protease gd [Aphomia sociella]